MRALLIWTLIFALVGQSSPLYAQGDLTALTQDYSTLTVSAAEYTDESYSPYPNYVDYEEYLKSNNHKVDSFKVAHLTADKIEDLLNVNNVNTVLNPLYKGTTKNITRIFENYIAELFTRQLATARLAANGFFKAAEKEQAEFLLTLGKITKLLELRLDTQRKESPDIDIEIMKILLIDSAKFTHDNLGLLSRGQKERIQMQAQILEKKLISNAEFKAVVDKARISPDVDRNLISYTIAGVTSFMSYLCYLRPITNFLGIHEPSFMNLGIILSTLLTLTAVTSYASVKSIAGVTYKYSLFSNNNRIIKKALQSCEGLLRRGPK